MRNNWLVLALALIACFALIACSNNDDPPAGPVDPGDPPPVVVDGLKADAACTGQFDLIPPAAVAAVSDLRIYYGHTSHGSQLVSGMVMIENADPSYVRPDIVEPGGDLGHNGSLTWMRMTRNYLEDHADVTDVVIWSWCGGASDNTPEGIDIYLDAMNQLEIDFPHIVFIYMTGHLDGTGPEGDLYANNNRIRDYCDANEKWLFDFADIESYDPDGNYYPDETDYCHWCVDWCDQHDCPSTASCAHAHSFNCWRKGQAFWWLLARITGWSGE